MEVEDFSPTLSKDANCSVFGGKLKNQNSVKMRVHRYNVQDCTECSKDKVD